MRFDYIPAANSQGFSLLQTSFKTNVCIPSAVPLETFYIAVLHRLDRICKDMCEQVMFVTNPLEKQAKADENCKVDT
jgi:hypothetical protein